LNEWDKGQIQRNIKRILKHLGEDIQYLEDKKTSNKSISDKIHTLREDISTVMYGNFKKYIDQFSTGWVSYLSPASMKTVKELCIQEKKEFEDKHGINPGIVKVISKKA